MSMKLVFTIACLGVLLTASAARAHHSFSAVYDANKPVTLKGTVSKMGWQNPHTHIYIDVKGPDGKVTTWEIESAGASNLLRAGLRREDFIGTEVVVKGFLAKDGTLSANASSFTVKGKEFINEENPR